MAMHLICKVTESNFFSLLACMNKKKIDEDDFFANPPCRNDKIRGVEEVRCPRKICNSIGQFCTSDFMTFLIYSNLPNG